MLVIRPRTEEMEQLLEDLMPPEDVLVEVKWHDPSKKLCP